MAKIYIKRKTEPVTITNTRARLLKEKWMSSETDPASIVDLGEWAGQYSEIKSIEFESEYERPKTDLDADWRKEMDQFKNLKPEEKAMHTGRFSLFYSSRHDWKKPSEEVLIKARAIQLEYYKRNPDALFVPTAQFEAMVGGRPSKTIGQRMQYQPNEEGKAEYKRMTGKDYNQK